MTPRRQTVPFRRVGLVLMVLLAAARGDQGVTFRLAFETGERLAYHEHFEGRGELARYSRGGAPQTVPIRVAADGERSWLVEGRHGDGYRIAAQSRRGEIVLSVAQAEFRETRAWRGFRLWVTGGGAVADAEPLEVEGEAVEPTDEEGLPIDLDIGEMFVMAQLGLLPPRPLAVGETWRLPAGPDEADERDEGDEDATPLRVEGRLVSVEGDPGERIAALATTFRTLIPERPTPAPRVVVDGELEGDLQVEFEVDRGRVRAARGPLRLVLRFKRPGRGGEPLATARLQLDLSTERLETPPRR